MWPMSGAAWPCAPAAAHERLAHEIVHRHVEPVAARPAVDGGADLVGQGRLHMLVGLDLQHPFAQAGVEAGGFALAFQGEDAVDDAGAELAGDVLGAVGAAVGDHDDLVAEVQAAQAVGQTPLVVMRADQSR
jgi:hypothetical protein